MDRLVPVINKLQNVCATAGLQPIDLKNHFIAVVGYPSVGKSSVLENIVGRDFLPRGSDIVTRRPLCLQLCNTSDESSWGEFLHKGSKKYYDFNEVRKEIESETERLAPNKAIKYEPISLKIYSPNVLNLTLIDLPGITKMAVANQPPDIGRRIRKLIRSFISRPKCLILVVCAATSYIPASDAIQLAKECDPKGLRTLGVITKIDLMDQGTNALSVLRGDIIPLHLGYIGVINRSQKDINNNKSISDALNAEKLFFKNHPSYRSIANICGTSYLAYKLNQILITHIKKRLPELKQSILPNIQDLEQEIESYGNPQSEDKGALLLNLISKFSDNFSDSIDAINAIKEKHYYNDIINISDDDKFGGDRILYIFRTEFTESLKKIRSFDGLSDDFILNSMRNASEIRSSLFTCFENLVKIQIAKLRRPCIQCVDLVFAELKRIATQSETPEIVRFGKFRAALNDCVTSMLKRHLEPSRVFANRVIDIELAYINTNHPDFISIDDALTEKANHYPQSDDEILLNGGDIKNDIKSASAPHHQKQPQQQWGAWGFWGTPPNAAINNKDHISNNNKKQRKASSLKTMNVSQRDQPELLVIKRFIRSYFNIVKKNIADLVPKSIMFMLVNKSKQRLQNDLALSLYREDQFEELFSENPEIVRKRKAAKDLLCILEKALQIINEVNDYPIRDKDNDTDGLYKTI